MVERAAWPWRLGNRETRFAMDDPFPISNDQGEVIAVAQGMGNARLVASAPELLEVLEKIRNEAEISLPQWLQFEVDSVVAKATWEY